MPWWGWIALGSLLLAAEMGFVDLEFYLVFLGVSALLVGMVQLGGTELPFWGQWLLFAVLAVGSLGFFRGKIYGWMRENAQELPDNVVGEVAVASERIEAGGNGSVQLRGTPWTARNVGSEAIEAGERAHVERTEGVSLHVRRES